VSIYVRTYSYDGTYTGWTYHNTPVLCVDVQNNGPNDATGVEIKYIIGDGLTLQNFSTRGYGTATYDPLTRTITWLIGTIPNGGRVYMDLTTQIIKTGTTNVTAILTKVDQNNTDTQHQQKTRTITVVPSADIQVTQTINPNPNYDNSVIITVTAQNNGPNDATGVAILDQLPAGLTLQSYNIQGKGTYDPITGIWTIGNLTNGENSILTIIATVTQTGTITNTAQRNGTTQSEWNQQDWNINNNAQKVIINVVKPSVEPSVSIYVRTYSYDGTYTGWTYHNTPVLCVDVQNNGPNDATGVEIKYIIGDGLTLQNFSTRGYGTATYDPLTRTITWLIGTIPNGGRVYMDLTTQIIKTGTTNVTAILTKVDQNNTDTQHQQKTRTITVVPSADIQVTQTINPNPNYDNSVIITVTAQNNGPNDATGVAILDQLPAGLTLQSYNIQGKGTYDPITGIWTIGNLTNGENSILTIIATVTQTGTITNTAQRNGTTQSEWNQQDWNINNNAQKVNLIIPASADIQVNQSSDNYSPNYLDNVTLTITTKNNGPNNATGVQTKIVLPSGLQYISHTLTNGTYDPITGIWNIGNLNNQESVVLTIIAKVVEACNVENTASKSAEVQYDPVTSNNAQTVTLNIAEAAYVEVNKSATPSNPNYHDTVTYTINATNKGPDNATGVNINYGLPSGLTLIGSSATRGSYSNGVWNIGNLANGETVTLTITALINATGTITDNSLTVTQDQYKWNNTLPVPINWNIPQSADIQVTQTVNNTTPTAETNVNFSITTKNNGPNNASGVQVTSKLPTGFTVLSWKVSRDGGLTWTNNDGSYNSNTGLWTIGALNNAATFILNITARTPAQMGNFTNNATKTAETQYDWNSSNNAQNVSLAVTGTIPDDIFTNDGKQSGTVNTDDGSTTAITLPFTITLYGQTYNTIYISVNGAIGLGAPIQGPYYYLTPESNTANRYVAYIAPFWADFDVEYIGSITYTITNNQVNITWYRVPCHSDNRDSNNVNTVTLILTNESTYGFIYGNLNWKNDPSDSYPSYARISKGDNGATYKNFWTGDQELSEIANKSFWFDSNGNLISGAADIGVTQSAGASTLYLWGSNTTTLTITVTNNGPNTATGVQIKEVLDSHISYRSHTASPGTSYNSGTGIWNIGTLASGESKTLVITVRGENTGSGASTATKTVEDQYDPVENNNQAASNIQVRYW
ncbi:hypothetical protein, partial [Methanobacterium formicicum]|uniref:hypothetical protein n=1 Tax=Methanobacterium formicicum TaxID=2162 RepID=UPI0024128CF4